MNFLEMTDDEYISRLELHVPGTGILNSHNELAAFETCLWLLNEELEYHYSRNPPLHYAMSILQGRKRQLKAKYDARLKLRIRSKTKLKSAITQVIMQNRLCRSGGPQQEEYMTGNRLDQPVMSLTGHAYKLFDNEIEHFLNDSERRNDRVALNSRKQWCFVHREPTPRLPRQPPLHGEYRFVLCYNKTSTGYIGTELNLYCHSSSDHNFKHSFFNAGMPVRCAGMLTAFNGKIISVSNGSGHYQPPMTHMQYLIDWLSKSPPENPQPKSGKVYDDDFEFWERQLKTSPDFKVYSYAHLKALRQEYNKLSTVKRGRLQKTFKLKNRQLGEYDITVDEAIAALPPTFVL